MLLNAALYQELARLRQPALEVFCFNNVPDGIKHFADTTHVKAEELPTPEVTEQIKKEQESLPPLGWLTTLSFSDAASAAVRSAYQQRASAVSAVLLSGLSSNYDSPIVPPPDIESMP